MSSLPPQVDAPSRTARAAGLRYTREGGPGFTRTGAHPKFRYVDERGRGVKDDAVIARIRRLVLPPAWSEVWINRDPRGHLQATGRDARGRKQYRYHDLWRTSRDQEKFDHMAEFARSLPRIRLAVTRDLAAPSLSKDKVTATMIRLLETSLIRVGNEEYARTNESYGLTTLLAHHATIEGRTLKLSFKGKSGIRHRITVNDGRLARMVRAIQDLPGQELFQFVGADGQTHRLRSDDINDYLRRVSGGRFTAKDYRTWAGTVFAAVALAAMPMPTTQREAKHHVVQAVKIVAARLGNTPTVCKKSYIHPAIIQGYLEKRPALPCDTQKVAHCEEPLSELRSEERCVLAYLEEQGRRRRRKPPGIRTGLIQNLRQSLRKTQRRPRR